jgi:hypothetical protein
MTPFIAQSYQLTIADNRSFSVSIKYHIKMKRREAFCDDE